MHVRTIFCFRIWKMLQSRVSAEHLLHRFMRAATVWADRDRGRVIRDPTRWCVPSELTGSPSSDHGSQTNDQCHASVRRSDSFLMGCPSKRHAPASLSVYDIGPVGQLGSQAATTWPFITRCSSWTWYSSRSGRNLDGQTDRRTDGRTDGSSTLSSRSCCSLQSALVVLQRSFLSKLPINFSFCWQAYGKNTYADNKQFSRKQLPDFKNCWSCLVLTLLWIKQYIYSTSVQTKIFEAQELLNLLCEALSRRGLIHFEFLLLLEFGKIKLFSFLTTKLVNVFLPTVLVITQDYTLTPGKDSETLFDTSSNQTSHQVV